MIDLRPAAQRTADLVTSLDDDQLGLPTPCPDAHVGDLIDHLGVFAVRFHAAARKETEGGTAPSPRPSGANLEAGWRDRISRHLLALEDAWSDPRAWDGSTHAGGVEMPAEVVGLIALDELVVHGWDIAAATGRRYEPSPPEVEAAVAFVVSFDAPRDGRLFGPVVSVADDAAPLDRLLGLTGRDPLWQRPGREVASS
jgi:uncharacterized protein (TIGR03086 family)